jgi:hypothetical protein
MNLHEKVAYHPHFKEILRFFITVTHRDQGHKIQMSTEEAVHVKTMSK